ncbi:MAG: hypothetical protein AAB518_02060, partial [Patescibacteria group bacterium]
MKRDSGIVTALIERGIEPPSTASACLRLFSFIRYGNGTIGKNEAERVEIIIQAQQELLGTQVVERVPSADRRGEIGRISFLTTFTPEEIRALKSGMGGRMLSKQEREEPAVILGKAHIRQTFMVAVEWSTGVARPLGLG